MIDNEQDIYGVKIFSAILVLFTLSQLVFF